MTIPPEGASDGFANNFDQLKWRKTSFHLFGFSRTCQIWAEPLIAPFYISPCHLSHLLPEITHFSLFIFFYKYSAYSAFVPKTNFGHSLCTSFLGGSAISWEYSLEAATATATKI